MPVPFHMLAGLGFTSAANEILAQSSRGGKKINK